MPTQEDLYEMGTLTKVKQMLKLPNGTIRVLVEGLSRAKLKTIIEEEHYFAASLELFEDEEAKTMSKMQALMRTMLEYFEQYIKLSKKISAETFATVADIEEPGRMADIIASHLPLKLQDKQDILEIVNVKERLGAVIEIIHNEREVLNLREKNWPACQTINGKNAKGILFARADEGNSEGTWR